MPLSLITSGKNCAALNITFNNEHDFNWVVKDAKDNKVKEWAKRKGFEVFLTKQGIAFKGKKVPTYRIDTDTANISVYLNNEHCDLMVDFQEVSLKSYLI